MKRKTFRKYKKHRKTFSKYKKHRNTLKKNRKTLKKNGGGFYNLLNLLAGSGLVLTLIGQACGKINIMTACAGNTCRSPVGEFYIKTLLGEKEGIGQITSRGVSVRAPDSPMAPYSQIFSKQICGDNSECIKEVEAHKSQSFKCEDIIRLIDGPDTQLRIIPMDDITANKILDTLNKCNLTPEERKKIVVGLDCDMSGTCNKKSAEIPDPFFQKGTPYEHASYTNMVDTLSKKLDNEFNKCENLDNI
jgi:protein-tyrosine-phosphatase